MDKVQRYKKMFPVKQGENENLVIDNSGKANLPVWLAALLIDSSGLKTRKKRHLKKRLKRELTKIILSQINKNE